MLDKSIPYCNVLMRYDGPPVLYAPDVPNSFEVSGFKAGDEIRWAQMEVDNNDFDTIENATTYFTKKYMSNMDKLLERFIGVRNHMGKLVGSVICWDDIKNEQTVSSVHWLITDPDVQGNGVGTFLVRMLVYKFSELGRLPIYLHTQPWSFSAIGIYSNIGFRLLKSDSFRSYQNETYDALPILKEYMPEDKFHKLLQEMI